MKCLRFTFVLCILTLFVLATTVRGFAAQTTSVEQHVVAQDGTRYKVKIDSKRHVVEVTPLDANAAQSSNSSGLTLTILKEKKILNRVYLKLQESSTGKVHYQGQLSPEQQSSVGVQFRIEAP